MYRSVFGIVLSVSLLLVGCSNNNANISSTELIINETVLYPENEPPSINIKNGETWEELSNVDEYPSKPEINTDKTKLAFIAPFNFEMAGEVWLYDASIKERKKVFSLDRIEKDNSAKQIIWVDNDNLVILTGNTFGTISSNRTLYLLNASTNNLRQLYQVENDQDIRDLKVSGKESISVNIITYNEDSTTYTSENKTIDFVLSE